MRNAAALVLAALAGAALFGCPYSKHYAPADGAERALFGTARRDIYPDDIREGLEGHRSHLVLWTGIIKAANFSPETGLLRLRIEHHYWDWIEDHGPQKAVAFLSPRGEGFFECTFRSDPQQLKQRVARVDDMAIVHGLPLKVSSDDGTIDLQCASIRTMKREYYSTEIWEYGRNFSNPRSIERR